MEKFFKSLFPLGIQLFPITHRTTESNILIGYITFAMDSNWDTLELNSLYQRFPVKLNLFYSGYMFNTCITYHYNVSD